MYRAVLSSHVFSIATKCVGIKKPTMYFCLIVEQWWRYSYVKDSRISFLVSLRGLQGLMLIFYHIYWDTVMDFVIAVDLWRFSFGSMSLNYFYDTFKLYSKLIDCTSSNETYEKFVNCITILTLHVNITQLLWKIDSGYPILWTYTATPYSKNIKQYC